MSSTSPQAEGLVAGLLARCRFPAAGTPVTCAVSGGADSLALLVLAAAAGCDVTAAHVDHGLRAGSSAEAAVVAAAADRLGARFRALKVSLAPGPNLEARARAARYAVLPAGVLTGHTLDDQAETVVLNLLRGAGLDGLRGMRDGGVGDHVVGRPLLAVRRAETRALCDAVGVDALDDPSNGDPAFRRNRVRNELLPLASDVAQRDVAVVVARSADLLADDADLLDALAADLDPSDARALAVAPVPLARRALRAWLRADGHPPDAATVERVLAVVRHDARATEVGGGRRVVRSRGRLRLESAQPAPPVAGAAVTGGAVAHRCG